MQRYNIRSFFNAKAQRRKEGLRIFGLISGLIDKIFLFLIPLCVFAPLRLCVKNVLLTLHTLKHLRWEQLIYRPLRVAQFALYRLGAKPAPAPTTISSQFTFLNNSINIENLDWNHRYESHLWNYHLHYFDNCNSEKHEHLISSWIDNARIGLSDGWEPYPLSLRIVNWINTYSPTSPIANKMRKSIYQQLQFLDKHLEYHLLANHLIKNAKALFIGGLFFNEHKWIGKGWKLLMRELNEQILPDGGHFERSPMYHAQVVRDYLECIACSIAFRCKKKEFYTPKGDTTCDTFISMTGFLEAMSYSDGTFALFNDSANTEETKPQPIIELAQKLIGYEPGNYKYEYRDTGYYLWESEDRSEKIIVDAGPPSVAYNMAHAHCDMLSYELRLNGKPFIVDSGVHGYGGDPYREYCRSTRAHNTVLFDGREQSETWGTFRVARRAKVVHAEARRGQGEWQFRGAYQPYYDSSLTHERKINRFRDGTWIIEDKLISGNANNVESFIHLHPNVLAKINGSVIECAFGNTVIIIEPFNIDSIELINTQYFPSFGISVPNTCIVLKKTNFCQFESFYCRIQKGQYMECGDKLFFFFFFFENEFCHEP